MLGSMSVSAAGKIQLRPATPADFDMALNLYIVTMKPLTAELMTWDENKQSAGFAQQWNVDDAQIITFDGRNVGWLQAAETASEIFLQQLFVSPEYHGRGIGTKVLRDLLKHWQTTGKPVVLNVLKNNPVRSLYERLGFSVVGEVGVKLHMRRNF
jgi:ribosomal protein S18 acetylase RimI-like enzyme